MKVILGTLSLLLCAAVVGPTLLLGGQREDKGEAEGNETGTAKNG